VHSSAICHSGLGDCVIIGISVIPNECEESLISLTEFTLSKHEGLGTRISRFTGNDTTENYDTVSKGVGGILFH